LGTYHTSQDHFIQPPLRGRAKGGNDLRQSSDFGGSCSHVGVEADGGEKRRTDFANNITISVNGLFAFLRPIYGKLIPFSIKKQKFEKPKIRDCCCGMNAAPFTFPQHLSSAHLFLFSDIIFFFLYFLCSTPFSPPCRKFALGELFILQFLFGLFLLKFYILSYS
jgi:hypothetical protein